MKVLLCTSIFFTFLQVNAQQKITIQTKYENKKFLDTILTSNLELKPILNFKNQYNIQIIYTKIDRDKNNFPHFTDYTFNVNKNNYFYPASTVKMPVAFLALEKMQELKKFGIDKQIIDSIWNKHQNGSHNYQYKLWCLLMFQQYPRY